MEKYDPVKISAKWQKKLANSKIFKAIDGSKKPKFYVLDMFPYPSGAGLHVGHPKGYIATDVISRFKRIKGYNVLHPMGWDAFGLPAENYAIENKIHPAKAVKENIEKFKKQISLIGLDYDWSREINTSDPKYYKWTQWIFLQLFKNGLAYESSEPINWCPSCKTGLANEDLENGRCERCGSEVVKKPVRQWVLKITDYAEKLLSGLNNLDWDSHIKEMQRNWIGRSNGLEVFFDVEKSGERIKVFTTRADTIFGVSAVVLAPENNLAEKIIKPEHRKEVEKYINASKKKSDLERTHLEKEKTGVFTGSYCINPANNEKVPIWVGDYVVAAYGGGAVMVVPGHDKRDYEFAKKYGLEIKEVVKGGDISKEAFVDYGILVNSGKFDGLDSLKAIEKISKWLEDKKSGKKAVHYKLRDWVFSRQRYWGEPIPLIHCQKCGIVAVPEKELPVLLPDVKSYEPTGTGESPLAKIEKWVNVKCPKCKGPGKRETNTMPNWAGSCWYYLRYMDPKNNKVFVDKNKEKYWSPVDLYIGGAEHATRHLIYARFWHRFLYDIGMVNYDEPFKKLKHVGLILASDGRKMSKRWGNVVNPDDIIKEYGADTLRVYEMFMGPFDQQIAWNTKGVKGAARFLDKAWLLQEKVSGEENNNFKRLLSKTIKKVSEDIEAMKFNTAISSLMILTNEMDKEENISSEDYSSFLILLNPFAPFLTEEIRERLKLRGLCCEQKWPEYDSRLIKDDRINLIIQINGKVRDKIEVESDISEESAKKTAMGTGKIKKLLEGKEIKKIIFVPNRLINIVI
ncbi:MAG: leucine--tRNA ligase [Candidatus Nealsonbacteria bacterium]|nr:leucine--tRNA ligase [Candidatus Nealsonbacteria bacterium]